MDSVGRLARIPFGLLVGTVVFWVGLGRLVFMSTRLTLNVMRGQHPYDVLARMNRERTKRS